MRYHTKEYYTLMMGLGTVDLYEPVIDKEYSDEEIDELYQKALDKYIEEERADYDAPPELFFDEDIDPEDFDPEDYLFVIEGFIDDDEDEDDDDDGVSLREPEILLERHPSSYEELMEIQKEIMERAFEAYENRPPFDENEAKADFDEMYRDNLEEPDDDLPEWVRETVDPRILAMNFLPEKIYRKLMLDDEANSERFDELDDAADEALESLMEELPEEYCEFAEILEDVENEYVAELIMEGSEMRIVLAGWDEDGEEEAHVLKFSGVQILENEGLDVESWEDEDGDTESNCELLFSELYMEDERPEVHMLFDNDGLKYLTFRCDEAHALYDWRQERASIIS